jgi:hypothetical protein
MSDSGFSGLPPKTEISSLSYPPSRAEVKAQIIEIKGEYKAANVRSQMEGEIVSNNKDGSTRIKTDNGEITAKFSPNERPAKGDKIIIEIPTGNPPTKLTARPAETADPKTIQTGGAELGREKNIRADSPNANSQIAPAKTKSLASATRTELKPDDLVRFLAVNKSEIILKSNETVKSNAQMNTPFTSRSLSQLIETSSNLFQTILPKSVKNILPAGNINQTNLPPVTQQPIILGVEKASNSLNSIIPPSITALTTPITSGILQNTDNYIKSGDLNSVSLSALKSLDVKITNIIQPNIELSTSSKPKTADINNEQIFTPKIAGEFTGKIIGIDNQNFPVIAVNDKSSKTPSFFSIQVNAGNLSTGSEINFIPQLSVEVSGLPASSTPAASIAGAPITQILPGISWPAFDELIQVTQQLSPRAASNLAQTIPNPGVPGKIAPSILFFVAAVRGGDINSWLGDKTLNLLKKSGKSNLLNRLNADITNLSRLSSEPVSQEWRLLSLPLYWQGDVSKMQLFYRHDGGGQDNEDQNNKKGTRFLFDLTLDKMGPVQLDGLHRPKEAGGRLDLVVRTQKPLSASMQNAMRLAYINALNQTDVIGEILFQGEAEKFVNIDIQSEGVEFSA